MQVNTLRPGTTTAWIAPTHCPHNEVAFEASSALSWCEACGTVLTR